MREMPVTGTFFRWREFLRVLKIDHNGGWIFCGSCSDLRTRRFWRCDEYRGTDATYGTYGTDGTYGTYVPSVLFVPLILLQMISSVRSGDVNFRRAVGRIFVRFENCFHQLERSAYGFDR